MIVCPVDLRVCEHPSCRGGLCEMSALSSLFVCWDCGGVSEGSTHAVICVECLSAYRPIEANVES
jgi:hypothetical protein